MVEISSQMDTLKSDIKNMLKTTRTMEGSAETEVLSDLKDIQNKMSTCKSQLETLNEWDQLCSSCEESLSSEETEVYVYMALEG